MRALPNRLVEIFLAFVEFPEACVVPAQVSGGVGVGRVERERALMLRDGFTRTAARLEPKDAALQVVGLGPVWVEGERLGRQFVGPLEVAFRVARKRQIAPAERTSTPIPAVRGHCWDRWRAPVHRARMLHPPPYR